MLLALGVALGVAALDYRAGFGDVPWHALFVIPVVWIALWSAEDDILPVTIMAAIATMLALARVIMSHGIDSSPSFGERAVIVGIIWITVLLALLRKRTRRTFKWIKFSRRP